MTLEDRLIHRIRESGPLPFEEFMASALYDPTGGFFSTGGVRSTKEGDFLTSPEVSPMFGETLARFVDGELGSMSTADEPGSGVDGDLDIPRLVVEAGAGSGSLLRPLLDSLDTPLEPWAVEASPAARASLADRIPEATIVSELDELPDLFEGAIIANELIDNLPVALAVWEDDDWVERWVDTEHDKLVLVPAPARPVVEWWCVQFAGDVAEGGVVEVQLAAWSWIHHALERLLEGPLIVIDYGDTAAGLAPRRAHGTLRTYRAHHLGPHPLDEPGATDITVDVNFTALAAACEDAGSAVEVLRQEEFLSDLGLRDRLSELRHKELELARSGEAMERLMVRSQKTEVETLLHPRGLGDFRVLIART